MNIPAFGFAVLSVYLLSAICYLFYFILQSKILKRISSASLASGALLHLIYIIMLRNDLHRLPLGTVYEVLSSATFLFVLLYLFLEFYIKENSMGIVIVPMILFFLAIALPGIDMNKTLAPQLAGLSFQIHVVFMLLAYSGFTIAFIASVMYLLLAREIHQKRLGFFFSRIPSLELLDHLNSTSATLGFGFATVGMFLGFWMGIELWGNPFPLDAKFISFVIIWIVYLFHLVARIKLGWRGERSAWLSVVGFFFVLMTFLVVSLFLTTMHAYR
ncbi:MAG: hypothetical protein GWP06_12810 [Actinobacteria bacterium]|nr:hypothetical protein [Actinomycetota bacterium]